MYYFKYPYIIYRNYPDYGYLTDNRNFGYDTASKSSPKFGERILSKTGSIFCSALTEIPRSLSDIVDDLYAFFKGALRSDLERDAEEFFYGLAQDGFIGRIGSLDEIPTYGVFSYNVKTPFFFPKDEISFESESSDVLWKEDYRLARVHLNVSGPCNEHCVHCYFPESYRHGMMSKTLFLSILEQCKACNVLNITLSGGEPLLNRDLPFFIESCRENNFSVNVLSNLTLLTDDLVSLFKRMPLLSIQTSLYSMDGVIHDSITKVKGSFEKTKRAIELLHEHNIPLQINCPIMKQNKDTYQDVLSWAKNLNIDANSDYMLFGCFDGSASNLACRLELSEVKTIIEKDLIQQTGKVELVNHDGAFRSESSVCPICQNSLCISYKGDVYPCEGWQSMILGNINDIPLLQLWRDSEVVNKLRHLTLEDDFSTCAVCEDRDNCSICLIRNANENKKGDYKEVNPYFCEIARIKRIAQTPKS